MIRSLLLSLGAVILVAILGAWAFLPVHQDGQFLEPSPEQSLLPNETAPSGEIQGDDVRISYPKEGDAISSTLISRGEARGPWYFEGSFPVILTDWDGLIIAEGYAQAEGEWMTTEFVPFRAALKFKKPAGNNNRGYLIYKKNNASGLPEHDAAFEIPVLFK